MQPAVSKEMTVNKMVALARNQEIAAYYDALPYQSFCFPQSAPEHLEAVALLFGLTPPSSAKARVLELGCAAGGNLLPFAERNPQARAVGVDISGVHIAQANAALRKMQLENVRFEQKDLSEIDASFGTFDYIICHGVYSWVPEDVQHAIMDIAGKCLAEDGIAYISYNTLSRLEDTGNHPRCHAVSRRQSPARRSPAFRPRHDRGQFPPGPLQHNPHAIIAGGGVCRRTCCLCVLLGGFGRLRLRLGTQAGWTEEF